MVTCLSFICFGSPGIADGSMDGGGMRSRGSDLGAVLAAGKGYEVTSHYLRDSTCHSLSFEIMMVMFSKK
jgi:hypothetical protein